MKALRLKLYQQTACYKKPFAFKVSETYPLPPHSTVKGMLHAVLNAASLIPMQISIQGTSDSLVQDYQTHYFFKKDKTQEFSLVIDGLDLDYELKDITTMPIYMHMLYDVQLLIHIQAEDDVLAQLEHKIANSSTHLSLGRWEDLVRIDECEIVQIDPRRRSSRLKYSAYVPMKNIRNEPHFPYKLNWTYRIVDGVRVWDKLHVGYVHADVPVGNVEGLYSDQYGDMVLFP